VVWTLFWDMHSGGGTKVEPFEKIYIEAPESEAKIIFYNRFGRNPDRVTCTCCGGDYSTDESDTLEQASGFHRGCAYGYFNKDGEECSDKEAWVVGKGLNEGYRSGYVERPCTKYSFNREYLTVDEYKNKKDVLIIYANEIKPEERKGELSAEGYVWL
jgi:hypothetical protein